MKHITLAVACVALVAVPAWGDSLEDFQSYEVGSLITGQGGWTGWANDTTFLAAVSDDPAGTAGNKVLKAFVNNDMVLQYTGYTSGAWVYRAKQYIPGSRQGTGTTSFILMNKYTLVDTTWYRGWGVSLGCDLTNNIVKDAEAGEGAVPVVYDQWVDIRVEIDLDANIRTTYYNNTPVGTSRWYDAGATGSTGTHEKSIAAVDLWADLGGDPVYYDDLSITPGVPVTPVPGTDITTTTGGTYAARYLVNLGQSLGDTIKTNCAAPTGLYEISNAGGNQQPWWKLNDRNPGESSSMVTYGGSAPDYVGYKFKLPANVSHIVWWNDARYDDGGTFAATPEVQYLDAVDGTWQTVADVTWDKAYNSAYVDGIRRYVVTLNNPPKAVWGIRLFGDTKEGKDDDGDASASTGFIGVTEMTLFGTVEVGPLDLSHNLAAGSTAIGYPLHGTLANLVDGSLTTSFDTYYPYTTTTAPIVVDPLNSENYLGVTWTIPQDGVAAMGVVFNQFGNGGYFNVDGCTGGALRIEYTLDGTTWTPVTGLDLGRYPADWRALRLRTWRPDTGFLFRFNPVSGITGLRIIGNPAAYGADVDGFVGAFELDAFANKTVAPAPQASAGTGE